MARDDREQPIRVAAQTSKRVERMSEDERAEVARKLAGRRKVVEDPRYRAAKPKRGSEAAEAARAEEAARVSAELRRTERRLDRFERFASTGRFQIGTAGPPTGRYARLLRRADRLERQLRSLS